MKRFLFAWELGGGLGHSVPLSQLSRPLLDAGHEVHVALRDLSTSHAAFGDLAAHPRLRLWQAPIWTASLRGLPETATYAELLFRAGFLDDRRLLGLVRGWRSLMESVRPDLLLVDHAPTALLASRGLGIPRAAIGTGFFLPPAVAPIPAFREWETVDPARVRQSEDRAIATANLVLAALGEAPIGRLHQLVETDEDFLLTWPELDHYRHRPPKPGARYWGPLPTADQGTAPSWPAGEAPRVFAYLKADYAAIEAALDALKTAPLRTVAYVPGLPKALVQRFASPHLAFAPGPVDMRDVCTQADAVVCNAGSGTVCTVLRAGIPVALLPMHAEQLLFSRRVAETGAGILVTETEARQKLAKQVLRLVREAGWRDSARAVAQNHAAYAGRDVALAVTARCIALAGG
jgi:UDP:flavonoid glycosyltransferase YjiC (YdhE family)